LTGPPGNRRTGIVGGRDDDPTGARQGACRRDEAARIARLDDHDHRAVRSLVLKARQPTVQLLSGGDIAAGVQVEALRGAMVGQVDVERRAVLNVQRPPGLDRVSQVAG